MRVVYFGTPKESVGPLRSLVEGGHDIAFVVTQPDRKRGRGRALVESPVKQAATELGLRVLCPARASEIEGELGASDAAVGVVVAFGQLLPMRVLDSLPLGFVNLHFSLLPRWRGAAPVERAILAGDAETGVCLMAMEEGLDTGPVYARVATPIGASETGGELAKRLTEIGTKLLVDCLPELGSIVPEPQVGESQYANKLTKDEFRLDPNLDAKKLAALVRAGNPRPGAWCVIDGHRLKVLRAEPLEDGPTTGMIDNSAVLGTVVGGLQLIEVQPEGKASMEATAWRNGRQGDVQTDQ